MMKGKMYLALPYNIDYFAGFYGQHSLLINLVCLFHKGFEVQIHYCLSTVVSGLADESALLFFRLDLVPIKVGQQWVMTSVRVCLLSSSILILSPPT